MPQSEALLGEVAKLITDEVTDSIDRIITLASGQLIPTPADDAPIPCVALIPAERIPREALIPAERIPPQANTSEANAAAGDQISPSAGEAIRPNTENPTPNTVDARIYLKPPHQASAEYIVNRALGLHGAEIDCYETTESRSERLQSAKDRETGDDYKELLTSSDKQFADALPMAIDRLMELAAGITVQRMRFDKPYTIARRPSLRAIEFIADRVAGKSGSILEALHDRIANPDTDREYTEEDLAKMSEVERQFLKLAQDRKAKQEKQATCMASRASTPNAAQTSDSPFPCGEIATDKGAIWVQPQGRGVRQSEQDTQASRPTGTPGILPAPSDSEGGAGRRAACGKSSPERDDLGSHFGAGGEGLLNGGEGYTAGGEGYSDELVPAYVTAAHQTLASFLPAAIGHMKTLARGAQTIIETETERKIFYHEPHARANTFLIDRFMGAPAAYVAIERIVEKTQHELTLERLAEKYPDIVAKYGSIQNALKAYAAKMR